MSFFYSELNGFFAWNFKIIFKQFLVFAAEKLFKIFSVYYKTNCITCRNSPGLPSCFFQNFDLAEVFFLT